MGGSIDRMTSGGLEANGRVDDGGMQDGETAGLEADIRQTQERLGDTIEEIGERFNPRRLKEEVKHDIRDATIGRMENMAQQTADMMVGAQRTVSAMMRENPIPVAMVGIGLGWLIWSGAQRTSSAASKQSGTNNGRSYDATGSARGAFASAKEKAGDMVDTLKAKGSELAEGTQETLGRVETSAHDVAEFVADESRVQARKVQGLYQDSPLIMGAAIFALGLAGGLALPATRKEAELIGETRDNFVDKARDVAEDTKSKVQEVAGRVMHDAQAAASDAAHAVGLMS